MKRERWEYVATITEPQRLAIVEAARAALRGEGGMNKKTAESLVRRMHCPHIHAK